MKNETKHTLCKFCGRFVNLWEEGVQYEDATCAHEGCEDADEFGKANAVDTDF